MSTFHATIGEARLAPGFRSDIGACAGNIRSGVARGRGKSRWCVRSGRTPRPICWPPWAKR